MNKPAIAHLANAALAVALSVSAASLLQAQEIRGFINGEKTSVKGVIESRNGDLMTIRTQKNALATIQILDETQVESTVGWGKGKLFRTKKTNLTVLMPGLAVNVSGEGNADGQLAAKKISFNPKDLETAAAIKSGTAGLAASQQQTQEDVKTNQAAIAENKAGIDANKQAIAETQETQRSDFNKLDTRVSDLDDYDVKTTVVVNFASGSTALAADDKQKLDDFSKQALGIRGYMVQVQGFADSSGNAELNQKLSQERANRVVEYLTQSGSIPLRRLLMPLGYGTARPVGENTTAEGRAENRRVEVKLIVNKAQAKS
jgi:OmpA-OmpF porin, OOP family